MGSSIYSLQARQRLRQLPMSSHIFQILFPHKLQRKLAEELPAETQLLIAQHTLLAQVSSQHQQEGVNQLSATSFLKFSCKLSIFPSATALYYDAFFIYFIPFKRQMNPFTFIQLEM